MLFSYAFLCVGGKDGNKMECKQFNEFWEADLYCQLNIQKSMVTTLVPNFKFYPNFYREISLKSDLDKILGFNVDVKIVENIDDKYKIKI